MSFAPQIPFIPLSSFSMSRSSSGFFPVLSPRKNGTAGSRSPQRVPMISPSSGVIPIDVSTLFPSRIAAALAPFPRWRVIRFRASGGFPRRSAARRARWACEVPWKP
jgi:hypothetical protein